MKVDVKVQIPRTIKTKLGDGDQTIIEALSVTENGTYTAPKGVGYSPVVVEVPTPSGEIEITEDGVYDVTEYASAKVNITGAIDDFLATLVDIEEQTNASKFYINFTYGVGIQTYEFEVGMTWRQWINSSYCTDNQFYITNSGVVCYYTSTGDIFKDDRFNNVSPDELIIENATYISQYSIGD